MATMASHGRNGMDRGRVGVVLFFWGQVCTPTLKTARAVIFTLNLKPLKPAIQLPKSMVHYVFQASFFSLKRSKTLQTI